MLCRTVGSSIFAMATVSEAVTSESRKELATQALSEPFRCISAPTVQKGGLSTTESASVTQALSESHTHMSKFTVRNRRCGPLKVLLEGMTHDCQMLIIWWQTKVKISDDSLCMLVNSATKRLHGSERFANSLGQPARAAFAWSFSFATRMVHRVHVPDKSAKS